MIGSGTFSTVYKARKEGTDKVVALKFIRANVRYVEDAQEFETQILEKIRDTPYLINLLDSFLYQKKHFVMVFPCLDKSLYDHIKEKNRLGLEEIRNIALQFATGLCYLHELHGIVHTDLKPENVIFTDASRKCIQLIDFGSSIVEKTDHKSSIISTRQYRAPEVILDCIEWDFKADVWSFGCILMEMFTGKLLFRTHNSHEHLNQIETVTGRRIPWYFSASKKYFTDNDNQRFLVRTRQYKKVSPLVNQIFFQGEKNEKYADLVTFYNLVNRCLTIDPRARISMKEILQHPFFFPHTTAST